MVSEIRITGNLEQWARSLPIAIQKTLEDEVINLADELQRNSPEGATGDLKRGWDVQSGKLSVTLRNRSKDAYFRVVGRKAGKFPPSKPIRAWVLSKGLPPGLTYVIQRKIAEQGTERYRSGENWAGINTDGSLNPTGAIAQSAKRIGQKLRALKV